MPLGLSTGRPCQFPALQSMRIGQWRGTCVCGHCGFGARGIRSGSWSSRYKLISWSEERSGWGLSCEDLLAGFGPAAGAWKVVVGLGAGGSFFTLPFSVRGPISLFL